MCRITHEEELHSQLSKLFHFGEAGWKARNVNILFGSILGPLCELRLDAGSERSWCWSAEEVADGAFSVAVRLQKGCSQVQGCSGRGADADLKNKPGQMAGVSEKSPAYSWKRGSNGATANPGAARVKRRCRRRNMPRGWERATSVCHESCVLENLVCTACAFLMPLSSHPEEFVMCLCIDKRTLLQSETKKVTMSRSEQG